MLAQEITNSVINSDKKWLIMGLGKSGVSVARFLRAQGQQFIAVDTRRQPPNQQELENLIPTDWLQLGDVDQSVLNSVDTIILSPGLSKSLPSVREAVEQGVELIGDIELFARYAKAPIVAITGSNGKTTVTSLLGQMSQDAGLNVKVGGNIGTPVLDILPNDYLSNQHPDVEQAPIDFYILELSSFQLETTSNLNAKIVTVLNLSADHMDRYSDLDHYAAAKYRIYQGATAVIINKQELSRWGNDFLPNDFRSSDFLLSGQESKETGPRLINYGLDVPGVNEFGIKLVDDIPCIHFGAKNLLPLSTLKLLGAHNHQNIMAALALGSEMGLNMQSMLKTIEAYPGLEHRTQWVACQNEVTWINDSKGTNVGATIAALQGLPGEKILIAGGVGKDADFGELQNVVKKQNVRLAILFGCDAEIISKAIQAAVKTVVVGDLQAAVQIAHAQAQPGSIVLFSPACASFDMFRNFEERGNAFIRMVKETLQC